MSFQVNSKKINKIKNKPKKRLEAMNISCHISHSPSAKSNKNSFIRGNTPKTTKRSPKETKTTPTRPDRKPI